MTWRYWVTGNEATINNERGPPATQRSFLLLDLLPDPVHPLYSLNSTAGLLPSAKSRIVVIAALAGRLPLRPGSFGLLSSTFAGDVVPLPRQDDVSDSHILSSPISDQKLPLVPRRCCSALTCNMLGAGELTRILQLEIQIAPCDRSIICQGRNVSSVRSLLNMALGGELEGILSKAVG